MKTILGFLAVLLIAGPAIPFFQYQRALGVADSPGQKYAVVDESLWQHANPDLSDIRLFSAETEVPYALQIERGGSETEQKECRILQPALVAGKTQFLIDMSGISQYDRITLMLATKDFVARARVEGQDDPHGSRWASLGATTLFDLSQEKLGHNSTLQIPSSTFKYLRVTVDAAIKPADLLGGTAGITRTSKAIWQILAGTPQQALQGRDTIVTFSLSDKVPVEQVVFEIDPAQPNFRREIDVQGDMQQPLASGEISRIHMLRDGQKIDVEQLAVNIRGLHGGTLKALIHNQDDQPLRIVGVHLQQYQRRIYFDSSSGPQPIIYYGDRELAAPVYDYAKLFQKDSSASPAQLSAEQLNPAYSGRPDERPWSERHPAVLWAAIIAAVLVLGSLAVRSMRVASAS